MTPTSWRLLRALPADGRAVALATLASPVAVGGEAVALAGLRSAGLIAVARGAVRLTRAGMRARYGLAHGGRR